MPRVSCFSYLPTMGEASGNEDSEFIHKKENKVSWVLFWFEQLLKHNRDQGNGLQWVLE